MVTQPSPSQRETKGWIDVRTSGWTAGRKGTLLIAVIVVLLRLPFLNQAIQGDEVYYLSAAEHAQIDAWHPNHATYLFQGDLVDMRGHPHPPLNGWALGALLAALGDVREIPFHLAYIVFSLIAALAMWSLARRFCERPFFATLLFLAVPAFVINGNSLEADLPFLAFWMAAIALFVRGVDRNSRAMLAGAAVASALAALAAYQSVLLTPILGAYLFEKRRENIWVDPPRRSMLSWAFVWAVILTAPLALGIWQLSERLSSGALPATMLAGYLQTYDLQRLAQKLRNAGALTVHLGWIVSPLAVVAAFGRGPRWRWIAAAVAALAGAFYDANPLCWASLACGVLVLTSVFRPASAGRSGFLEAWILIFFAGAVVVFFAGSARYLLPLAAPVAILAARSLPAKILGAAFVLQMGLSVALAAANYQHAEAYRSFAATLANDVAQHRTWINAEWGLRFYLESEGALQLARSQPLQPGEIVVTSELALPLPVAAPLTPLKQEEVHLSIPLRLISIDGRSAYSSAGRGIRPFDISTAPIDRLSASLVSERQIELSWIDPRDPAGRAQIVSGLFPDGWMEEQTMVLLKNPAKPLPLRAVFYIPPQATARKVQLLLDGQVTAEETFPAPGTYALAIPPSSGASNRGAPTVTVTLVVDKTFSVPNDQRKLGMVVTSLGFRP